MAEEALSQLLNAWARGDHDAFDRLFEVVYAELRTLASAYMRREREDHTLQTTALVHEAYLKLLSGRDQAPKSRLHFFAAAARVMRHILVDHARRRLADRRGGHAPHVPVDSAIASAGAPPIDILALDQALGRLSSKDQRKGQVVELRYFGGMTIDETAEYLGVSSNTVVRDWELARAWLYRAINERAPDAASWAPAS